MRPETGGGDGMSGVSVNPGGAEGFFDVGFDDAAYETAGVEPGVVNGISVEVDAETGEVTLNRGYERVSDAGHAETDLFRFHRDAIVEAVASHMEHDATAVYDAFRAAQAGAPAP